MPKMLLIFSHYLTPDQIEDAKRKLCVNDFVPLPSDMQKLWQNIPATEPSISNYLNTFNKFIRENANEGDYVLIQGDFGAVYLIVNFVFSISLIPVYATTERDVVEKHMPDNTVRSERVFKHRIFRRYEKEEKR
jgi:hypothetical protein